MPGFAQDRWRVLSPYLDQALETSEDQLAAWLDTLRAQDATLADDLEALLRDRTALQREGFLEDGPTLPLPASWVGETIGAYTVVALLGQGGMGSVWLARRSDGRFVGQAALKLLHAGAVSLGGTERFKREGSILGQLKHPHIAHLLDAGVAPTGQPYLVLEHVEGQHIDAYCDGKRLGVEARVRLVLDMLDAVAHAHANLIVHRDIKPSNVLVTDDGRVKLLDFGIAKLLEGAEPAGSARAALTREGGRALTPESAAPEQLTGGPITTATDVYAVGVLLYVLLSGRHPAGAAPRSPAALLKAIVELDPPRLSAAASGASDAVSDALLASRRGTTPDRLRRALRGDLETIVAKALKKHPAERYPSVTVLADDLGKYLRHEPIGARPDSLRYRAAKFVRRHRVSVALAALVLIALVGGLSGTIWQARMAARQRDFALAQLGRAESINRFNSFLLGDAVPAGPVHTILSRAERLADKRFANDNALAVELLTNIGAIYAERQENVEARRILKRAYEASQQLPDPASRATAACQWARIVAADGDFPAGRRLIEAALTSTSDETRFDNAVAGCLVIRANMGMREGTANVVVDAAEKALARLENKPAVLPETRVWALETLGVGKAMQGDAAGANRTFAQAFELLRQIGQDDSAAAAVVLNNWANNLAFTSPLEALALHRRVVAIYEGEDPDALPMPVRLNLGYELSRLAQYPEARAAHEEVRALARKHDNARMLGLSCLGIAGACRHLGDLACARAALAEAVPALKHFPPGYRVFADLAREQGLLAAAEGHGDEALGRLSEALGIDERVTEKHISHVSTLLELAKLELSAGKTEDAEKHARAALALAESFRGDTPHSSWVGLSQLALGKVCEARHDVAAAREWFRQAAGHIAPTLGDAHPALLEARQHLAAHPEGPGRSPDPKAPS
jgi:serine/threonine-protein kinase